MSRAVLSVSCRTLLAACKQLGLDTAALMEQAGCDAQSIDDPDGRIPPEQVFALWDAAYRASGDAHLAISVARTVPPGAYRVLDYLVQSAPTVGDACAKLSQYFSWVDPSVRLPVVEADGLIGLGIEVQAPAHAVPLRALEFSFVTCSERLRLMLSGGFAVARVDWAGAGRPEEVRPLADALGCSVVQGASGNRLLVTQKVWNQATTSADVALHQLLDRHAQVVLLSARDAPVLQEQTRRILLQGGPTLNIAEVSKKLGLSVRTLQRRLKLEGSSFAQLVDEVRAELAQALVRDRKTALAEVAILLGFSDQSSFTRSFKRWTGQPPHAYRAQS